MTTTMRRSPVPRASCLLSLALALPGCVAQPAVQAVPPAPTACRFDAFVQETDPAGLNVRAAPGTGGKVLGKLPPTTTAADNDRFHVRVEVSVLGDAGGWMRIGAARDNPELTGAPARPVFAGEGWVSGRKLTVKSQAVQGRAAPDAASAGVMSLKNGDGFDGDDLVDAGHLVACQGRWAQVEFTESALSPQTRDQLVVAPAARAGLPQGRFRAWVDQLCGVQETTCNADSAAN